jgi:hypothetical protein
MKTMTVAVLPAIARPSYRERLRLIADAFPAPERAMLTSGLTLLVMAVALTILIQVDTRMVQGVSTWLKPFKFAASAGLHLVTIGFLWNWLTPGVRDGVSGAILIRLLIVSCLFEVLYISYQGALGTRSHYNLDSPFTSVMFTVMGAMATVLVLATLLAGVAVLAVREAGAAGALRRVIGFGLVLSGALGLLTGAMLAINNGHYVGIPSAEAANWPIVGWSREVGDLRVSHFVAIHAAQAMPLIGLAATAWKRERAGSIVNVAALAILVACLATAWQAWSGLPLI